jgi:hypothetical protein
LADEVDEVDDPDLEVALDALERGEDLYDGPTVLAELRAEIEAQWPAATG